MAEPRRMHRSEMPPIRPLARLSGLDFHRKLQPDMQRAHLDYLAKLVPDAHRRVYRVDMDADGEHWTVHLVRTGRGGERRTDRDGIELTESRRIPAGPDWRW